jgi:putative transposase
MLEQLARSGSRYGVRIYAFVLMSNHYHLLAETPRGNLSRFMQHLNTGYTIYFNRRYARKGHLLEGRFKARLVEGERYLMALTRYVHLNPVRVKKIKGWPIEAKIEYLRGYRWSSYPGYAGLGKPEDFVDPHPLQQGLGQWRKKAYQAYREYVESGMAQTDGQLQQALKLSSKAIGGEGFCRWVEAEHQSRVERLGNPVEVRMRRVEVGLKPGIVLKVIGESFQVPVKEMERGRGRSGSRLAAMKYLHERSGLSQQQVAEALGLRDGSVVSRYLKQLPQWLAEDPALARTFQNVEKGLTAITDSKL